MLTRFLATIRPAAPVATAPGEVPQGHRRPQQSLGENGPDIDEDACSPGCFDPWDDAVRRFRALAESCTDGLTALAYAQFADLLELQLRQRLRQAFAPPGAAALPAPRRLPVN